MSLEPPLLPSNDYVVDTRAESQKRALCKHWAANGRSYKARFLLEGYRL